MLSVADTAHSVYPELVIGLPGLLESLIRSRRLGIFPFFIAEPFQLTPVLPAAGNVAPGKVELRAHCLHGMPSSFRTPMICGLSVPVSPRLVVDDAGIRFLSREAIPTLNPSTAVSDRPGGARAGNSERPDYTRPGSSDQ